MINHVLFYYKIWTVGDTLQCPDNTVSFLETLHNIYPYMYLVHEEIYALQSLLQSKWNNPVVCGYHESTCNSHLCMCWCVFDTHTPRIMLTFAKYRSLHFTLGIQMLKKTTSDISKCKIYQTIALLWLVLLKYNSLVATKSSTSLEKPEKYEKIWQILLNKDIPVAIVFIYYQFAKFQLEVIGFVTIHSRRINIIVRATKFI